jgi:hypothetical protein
LEETFMSSRQVLAVLVPAAVLLLFSAGQASAQCNGGAGQMQTRARPQMVLQQQRATLPQLGLQQTALQSQSPLQLYAAQQYALQQYALQQQNALMAAWLQQQQQNAALAALLQQQQNAAPVQLMAR